MKDDIILLKQTEFNDINLISNILEKWYLQNDKFKFFIILLLIVEYIDEDTVSLDNISIYNKIIDYIQICNNVLKEQKYPLIWLDDIDSDVNFIANNSIVKKEYNKLNIKYRKEKLKNILN